MRVICVKIGSLSEFETFLLAENLGLDYLSMNEIRRDKTVRKYWFDLNGGRLLAVERVILGEKEFDPMIPLDSLQLDSIRKSKPVQAGEPTRKFKGDIEEKRKDFQRLLEEERKYKEDMLNRKDYNPGNIVCINSKSTLDQVFAVCVVNDVDPVTTISFIYGNSHLDMTRVWFEKITGVLVAYSYYEYGRDNFVMVDCLIPKKAIYQMSHTPVNVPKLKVSDVAIDAYGKLKELGIDLGIQKLENVVLVQKNREFLEKLQSELADAIDTEDYEKAAVLRDRINALKDRD